VLGLRREQVDGARPADPNRRSAGSFFVNPVLSQAELCSLRERAVAAGIGEEVPSFAAGDDRCKIPAAWLIERAGFTEDASGASESPRGTASP
jgi:UDP-N-acetylmuramate dehydrogenase